MSKTTKRKIIVPIDFSEQSLIALNQSYNLAKEYDTDLLLLYVLEESPLSHIPGAKSILSNNLNELKNDVQARLNKLSGEATKSHGVAADSMIAKGKVYDKIIEVADMANAVMIVMGCNSQKKLKARFIGSNALRVVREAKCPVITIKGKQHYSPWKNLVLPVDLAKETKDKVRHAIQAATKGETKSAIRVVSILQSSDDFLVNRLIRQLDHVKTTIQNQGIECTGEIVKISKDDDSIAECIIDYANKVDGDVILIMTQQESNFTRMFIGSTAQEIVNSSDIPVMSFTPKERKYITAEEAASAREL